MPTDLKTLTSLRFFAAFWVFVFHLRSRTDFGEGRVLDFIDNGARGVDSAEVSARCRASASNEAATKKQCHDSDSIAQTSPG